MSIAPTRGHVAVIDDKVKETAGGIILPDQAQKPSQFATVIAIGGGELNEDGSTQEVELKLGDRIAFARHAGLVMKIDDQEVRFMKQREVLAVITKENLE
ncbi:MAG: co-chaperone GroES [Bacteroidetes bacterium]|nr:co-chaperone GroES [Bacteroidota bacterium]